MLDSCLHATATRVLPTAGQDIDAAGDVDGAGGGAGSEQLTSITIQTDPRQRTSGPVPTPRLVRPPEVPDTLSLARPADHRGKRYEPSF